MAKTGSGGLELELDFGIIENNNNKKTCPGSVKSELLVVKGQSEDLIRFKSPAEFVYRKWFLGGLL